MYHNEHQIAQAEFAAFQAKFNRKPAEGMTVQVPNIFDRMAAALKSALDGRKAPAAQPAAVRVQCVPAK